MTDERNDADAGCQKHCSQLLTPFFSSSLRWHASSISCRRLVFLIGATRHDLQRVVGQWPLQRLCLIPRRAHPASAIASAAGERNGPSAEVPKSYRGGCTGTWSLQASRS